MEKERVNEDDDFDGLPIPYEPCPCLHCGILLQSEIVGYGSIENPTDGFYTPWCNKFHYDAYHQTGLWQQQDPPPLSLET
jgi:hypothetical protein